MENEGPEIYRISSLHFNKLKGNFQMVANINTVDCYYNFDGIINIKEGDIRRNHQTYCASFIASLGQIYIGGATNVWT